MKKMFFLSCLLISNATHCMEKETQTTNLALQYSNIEQEVFKLDELLYENQHWLYRKSGDDPISILVACKYPDRTYTCPEYNIGILGEHDSKTFATMDYLKNARYEGYSAIGVVTLSTTVHYDEQKQIIQKMVKAGYVPTNKDLILIQHLEQKTNHNLPDGTSDLLDQTEGSYRCNLLHQFYRAIVYLCNLCPINLTQEDKQNLHLE
jgi:hypothetical protein